MATTMQRRSLDQVLLTSTAVFVVTAIAAVVGIQWIAARNIDRHAAEQTNAMVAKTVTAIGADLSGKTFAQAYWDDAVRNLDNHFSHNWARNYVGVFFWHTYGVNQIATVDRNDRVTFGMVEGTEVASDQMAELAAASAPLLAEVRKGERQRGPLPALKELDRLEPGKSSASSGPPPTQARRPEVPLRPITASGFVLLKGQPYNVAVTLVQPDRWVMPLTDRSAMIILAKRFDQEAVASLGANLGLDDPRLAPVGGHPGAGMATVPILDREGKAVAAVEWRANLPGLQVVKNTSPFLALFSLLLAFMAWLGLRRGRTIARELTESEVRASLLAYRDKLTGLPNRAGLELAFDDILADAKRRHLPLSIGCVDIDHFKSVNDSYGHPAGDQLLKEAAVRIEACCEGNYVLGRFGGDEFILICDGHGREALEKTAAAVTAALAEPFDVGPGRAFVGSSIGIFSLNPGEVLDAPEALRRADLAMYRAKELGGNSFAFYGPELDDVVKMRTAAHQRLRAALNDESLEVHYQPQFDAAGRIIGAEALVRWPQSAEQEFPPADFIRLAEQTGLIEGLGLHVLRRVIADLAQWPGLPLSVNLSALQIRTDDSIDQLIKVVVDSGIDPARLEFEITEGLLLDHSEATTRRIERLRALGCRVALDDFGTGYCGLSYLHLYPIDRVKIDMSFTALLGKEPRAQALVKTIVSLADVLELEVIAEGVETEEQRQLLIDAGCTLFQGYLTGRPMPASALSELLAGETVT